MMKEPFKYDRVVYFWSLLFLIPIPISLFLFNSSVRNYNYVWVVAFLFYVFKYNILSKTKAVAFSKRSIILFFLSVLISFNYSAVAQLYSFHVAARDFSIFDTMFQEALRGNWGSSTATGYYHFATHQNYILLVILPIYALFHNSMCLMIINATIIWVAGIVLWKIARLTCDCFWSFILVLSFYLSPHLGIGASPFYPEMFYPCLLFLLVYFYMQQRIFWLFIFAILFLSIKEDAILYAIGVLPLLIIRKDWYKALVLLVLIIAVAMVNFSIVSPYFLHKSHLTLVPTLQFWSGYGDTKIEILHYILNHPINVLASMFAYKSGFWGVYTPFIFIPLLCLPVVLVSFLPLCLFLSTTATDSVMYKLHGYYPIVLISLCFLGMLRFMVFYIQEPSLLPSTLPTTSGQRKILRIITVLILLTSSLWGSGAQAFYHIDWSNLNSFNSLYGYLRNNSVNSAICPGSSIYPFIQLRDFSKVNAFDDSGNVQHFLTQSRCTVVFSAFGDNYPYGSSVLYMINYANSHGNCGKIGQIYYCHNQ